MSAAMNLPLVWRLADNAALTRRLAWTLGAVLLLGGAGILPGALPAVLPLGRLSPALSALDQEGLGR